MNRKLHNSLQIQTGAISMVRLSTNFVHENFVHAWQTPAIYHMQGFPL